MTSSSTATADGPEDRDGTTALTIQSPRFPDFPVIPGYQLGRRLGAGSMGTVYHARRVSDGSQVAVKVLREELRENPRHVERFLREARSVSGINHPSILPVLEYGISQETPYLVTPYHAAGDLDQKIRTHGVLDVSELRRLASDCASALAELSRHGVLHRDLKPANILIAADGTAVLADFGIACSIQRGHHFPVSSDGVAGTPNYISPEQAAGRALDQRSDLFGLGGILFAAATGRPPFIGPNGYDVVAQVLRDQAPSVTTLRGDLPRDLIAIIDRCLQHRRELRYADASALLAHLTTLTRRRSQTVPVWLWAWVTASFFGHRPIPPVPDRALRVRPRPGWRVFYPAPLILSASAPLVPDIDTSELLALLRPRPNPTSSVKGSIHGRSNHPCHPRNHQAPPCHHRALEPAAQLMAQAPHASSSAPHRQARYARLKRRFARRVHPPGLQRKAIDA